MGSFGVVADVLLRLVCGAEIPRSVEIGPGLRLPHGGRGVVIHWRSRISAGVTIYHGVTLGVSGPDQGAPVVDSDAYIGTGACVLGGITVGANARVGANAVVLTSVPPHSTAVGVPAVVKGPR
nr:MULTISPECIES: hypothetical protein [Actinomycetes]